MWYFDLKKKRCLFKCDLAWKINLYHFLSIGKSNEEIKEENSFGNEKLCREVEEIKKKVEALNFC